MLDLALDPVLAALPFLPAGKGALILILGGLAMLAFSGILGRFSRGGPYSVGDSGDGYGRRKVAYASAPRRPQASPSSGRGKTASRPVPGRRAAADRRQQDWRERTRAMASAASGNAAKGGSSGNAPVVAFEPQRWDDAPARLASAQAFETGSATTEWVAGLRAAAASMGLGQGRMLQVNGERCVFFLAGCQSCRQREPGTHGCEATRRSIELIVRQDASGAKVTESACGAITHGACTFEIRRAG